MNIDFRGPSWPWSYGSWIYNYLCNQCLSPLTLWVRTPPRRGVLETTLCDQVCQWLVAGWWFSPGTPVSSTNKSEILLKVALNTINRQSYLFGDALLKSVFRPSITCACAVWVSSCNTSTTSLESWQYKVAKLILNTNINIQMSALFLKLGWEPINDYLDRQRVSYFARIKKLPITRLCKLLSSHEGRS